MPRTKTLMPEGWKPVTELESNILTAQTQEVLDISTHNFSWSGENIALQPRMTAAARRVAIHSFPTTPSYNGKPLLMRLSTKRILPHAADHKKNNTLFGGLTLLGIFLLGN